MKKNFIKVTILMFCLLGIFLFPSSANNVAESPEEPTEPTTESIASLSPDDLQVHFMNVGDGDFIFVKFGDTEILVDSGDEKKATVTRAQRWIEIFCEDKILEYVIVTHGDSDHLGNMAEILKLFVDKDVSAPPLQDYTIQNIVDFDSENLAGMFDGTRYSNYVSARESLKSAGTSYQSIASFWKDNNDTKDIPITFQNANGDEMILHLLHNDYYFLNASDMSKTDKEIHQNVISIVLCMEYGESKVLLTGDLEEVDTVANPVTFGGESALVKKYPELLKNVTLFKAAHHGSRSSNSEVLLQAISPKNVVISCNAGGRYKFPDQKSLNNFYKYGGDIYITGYKDTEDTDSNVSYKDYYGDVSVLLTKDGNADVTYSNKEIGKGEKLQDTSWYLKNRTVPTYIYEFAPDVMKNGNCTLIKSGAKEILINAGIYGNNSSRCYVDELKEHCRDGVIEYVIATNAYLDNLTQFVTTTTTSKDETITHEGIFDTFKIENLIDFGDVTNASTSASVIYKAYVEAKKNLVETKYAPAKEIMGQTIILHDAEGVDKDVSFTFLKTKAYQEKNKLTSEAACSICILVNIGAFRALFTGDLNNLSGAEADLVKQNADLLTKKSIDYYKISAHGSGDASSQSILELLKENAYLVANCIAGASYRGVNSGASGFLNQKTSEKLLKVSSNVYPTLYWNGKKFEEMHGTICVVFTSEHGEEQQHDLTWSNNRATEDSFEEYVSSL